MRILKWQTLLVFYIIIPYNGISQAQIVKYAGGLNLSSHYYSSDGIPERRQRNSYRAIFHSTLTIYDEIQLPFELYLTSEESGYRQPFNQFGIHPKLFGWMTIHVGYYSMRMSELSFGDVRLFGGGIELQPLFFRLSLFYGKSHVAVNPDTTTGIPGVYKRTMLGAKIGFGKENRVHLDLNFLRAVDDSASIINPQYTVTPKENVVGSLAFGIPLFDQKFRLTGEVGIAAFTNDTRSQEIESLKGKFGSLFTARTSSQVDGAARISIMVAPTSSFSLNLNGRWIGPGYVSLGYAQLPNDVLETTIAPSFRLFDNKVSFRASIGFRYNNLRNNRFATTRRTIGSLSGSAQLNQMFGFDINYQNYGMRSSPKNDSLRIDNISQSFSITPRFLFSSFGGSNTVMLMYGLQDFNDRNFITSSTSDNRTHSFQISWSLGLPSTLVFSTSYMYRSTSTSLIDSHIHNLGETISKKFMNDKLSTSITLGYNIITSVTSDRQFTARLNVSYRLDRFGTLTGNFILNSYSYGESAIHPSFSESQGSLQYSITF